MGQVLRAYDPRLDREVAIKVVREPSRTAAARLLREAKMMAAIRHPNVVPVYDVGTDGEDVFVAMELIHGQTLRDWCDTARPWWEVLDVFKHAAAGLDAAHRLGVVHRDFKPANVMVDLDDAGAVKFVRVMDFGLAVSAEDTTAHPTPTGSSEDVYLQSDRLTQTGTIVGTPCYLAPEQEAGAPGTPGTDQFAFCVALFEALYGKRPFEAEGHRELSRKKWGGEIEDRPVGTTVPQAVHEVVLRGLRADPTARWPSVPELVEGLEQAARPRTIPRWQLAGFTALAGAGTAAFLLPPDGPACDTPEGVLAEVWAEPQRDEVRAAFARTGLPFAASSSTRVVAELDDYAQRWVEAWPTGCEMEQVQAQQDCLRGRLFELSAVAGELAASDPKTVRLGMEMAGGLSSPASCALEAERAVVDPAQRDAVAKAERLRHRASAALSLGDYDRAETLLSRAGRAAAKAEHCPTAAAVLFLRAQIDNGRGGYDDALEDTQAAYFEAMRCDATLVAMDAARYAMSLHTFGTDDLDAAQTWYGHAVAQMEKLEAQPSKERDADRAVLLYTHAQLLDRLGQGKAALAELERADDLLRPLADESPELFSEFLATRGSVVLNYEGPEAALPYYEEGLEIAEAHFGAQHPMVAIGHGNLGNNYQALSRLEDAERMLRRTAELMPQAFGTKHPYVVRSKNALAQTLTLRGNWDEARSTIAEGMALALPLEPDGGPETRRLLGTRAAISAHEGDLDAARLDMQRLVDVAEKAGAIDGSLVWDIKKLAEYQIGLGRFDEATWRLEQADEYLATRLPDEHVLTAQLHATHAYLHHEKREYPVARKRFKLAESALASTLGKQSLEWAEVREAHADLIADMGLTDDARQMYTQLAQTYEEIEMPQDATRIRSRITTVDAL